MPPATKDTSDAYAHLRSGRRHAAITGVLWSSVTSLAPMVIGMLLFAITSRVLTPVEFGLLALSGSIVAMAAAFVPAAMGEALVQRKEIDEAHLSTAFWLVSGIGVIMAALLIALAQPIADFTGQPMLAPLIVASSGRIVFDMAAVVPNAILIRKMAFKSVAIRSTAASSIAAVACIGMLIAGLSIWAVVVSQIVLSLTAMVAAAWASQWLPRQLPQRRALSDLAHFSFYASLTRIIQNINVSNLLIGPVLGPAALGLYDFANKLFGIINEFATGALNSVSFSVMSTLQEEKEKLQQAYLLATFATAALSFPAFTGLALVADRAVPILLGAQWQGAIAPLYAFCAIGLLSCLGILQSSLIRSQGRIKWWTGYQAGQQLLTALAILLTYRHGIGWVGAAIASKVWLTFPLSLTLTARLIDASVRRYLRNLAAPAIATILMAGSILMSRTFTHSIAPAGVVVMEVSLGVITYALFLALLDRRRVTSICLQSWNKVRERLAPSA